MSKEKLDQNIQKNLFSANPDVTISALKEVRERGNKLYLPVLFDLLISNPEEEIKKEILKILGSIKKKDTVPVFIEALSIPKYAPIRKTVLTACWQNGLDFRHYLPLFVDIVIQDDWETGFEAFTVIESMEHYPEKDIVDEAAGKIHAAIGNTNDNKRYFLQEILALIQ